MFFEHTITNVEPNVTTTVAFANKKLFCKLQLIQIQVKKVTLIENFVAVIYFM